MKSNTFNVSLLAVGVAAVMGISTGANAATPTGGTNAGSFAVLNKAEATYTVNSTQQRAVSNEVTITVNETSSFSLVNDNVDIPINPQANSTATFTHTLKNEGNVDDSYILDLKNVAGDDFNYSGYVVTYTKTNNGTSQTVSLDANGKATTAITLTPNEIATITIVATANTVRNLDKNGILTVSAESAYLKAKNPSTPAAYTASNTDNAKTTTPVYAITKSATTNLGNSNFDLANAKSYVDYTITVKNEGNIKGTAVTIEDALPNGLILVPSTETTANGGVYTAPVIKRNGNVITTIIPEVTASKISFKGVDIEKQDIITITFRAKKSSTATSTSDFSNYATVKDNTKNDANADTPDLIDHSNDKTNGGVAEVNYENPIGTGAYPGKDDNTQATVTTTNQTRAIAITTGVNKEVALVTSGTNVGNTYIYTITNDGTDITEAATAGSVLFSVKPTATETTGVTDNTAISIARVFVDANDDGIFNTGETVLTGTRVGTTSEYTYDLNAAKAAGFAPGAANAIKIGVEVVTTGTGRNDGVNNIGNYETLTLSVLPQGPVNQTPAPTSVSTTSKTTMEGINLLKFQAVAACNTPLANIVEGTGPGNWSQANKTAAVTECLFYKIDAKNTFSIASGTNITNVAIEDTLASSVTYRGDFSPSKAVTIPSQVSAPLIKGTFATLTPQETVTIKFSAKPSQSGTN